MHAVLACLAVSAGCGYGLLALSTVGRLAGVVEVAVGAANLGDCPAQQLLPVHLIVSGCISSCPGWIYCQSRVLRVLSSFLSVCIGLYSLLSASPEFDELADDDAGSYCSRTVYTVTMATVWLRILQLLCEAGLQVSAFCTASCLLMLGAGGPARPLRPFERRLLRGLARPLITEETAAKNF